MNVPYHEIRFYEEIPEAIQVFDEYVEIVTPCQRVHLYGKAAYRCCVKRFSRTSYLQLVNGVPEYPQPQAKEPQKQ